MLIPCPSRWHGVSNGDGPSLSCSSAASEPPRSRFPRRVASLPASTAPRRAPSPLGDVCAGAFPADYPCSTPQRFHHHGRRLLHVRPHLNEELLKGAGT